MSAVTTVPPVARSTDARRVRARALVSWVLLGFGLILIASWVCNAPGIASSSTWGSALRLTVPIAVVAIGALELREHDAGRVTAAPPPPLADAARSRRASAPRSEQEIHHAAPPPWRR